MPIISVLITDLDNTLYDWLGVWHRAFSTLLDRVTSESGVPLEVLIPEIRKIHQEHGTSEYTFLLQEIPSLRNHHPDATPSEIVDKYRGAIDAYRTARREGLRLYPTVRETLGTLKSMGCLIVGHTESRAFQTSYRVRRLELDGLLDFVYSPPDHHMPQYIVPDRLRSYPAESYVLKHTVHRYTAEGEMKPNPQALLRIIHELGAPPSRVAYVGDSLMKDIRMAQLASVVDVYAKYGDPVGRPEYDTLRQVTRWTEAQVEMERQLYRDPAPATVVLEKNFSELLSYLSFTPFNSSGNNEVGQDAQTREQRH